MTSPTSGEGCAVTLTWYEFADCVGVGVLRFAASNLAQLNPATTYERGWLERLADEIVGACGERAWCKYRQTYWDASVNTFHRVPDAPGSVEVRSTRRGDGCLILRDNDAPERWYVLVTGEPPTLTIRGYIRGADARTPRFQRNPHGHRPAYFVPQAALRPVAAVQR